MLNKNKTSWNNGAAAYSAIHHSEKKMRRILESPKNAFHPTTWEVIEKNLPVLRGKKICVPSSGDNHAAFAFALLGAQVTSCDLSEKQLENAERVARQYGLEKSIEFSCEDTMRLDGIADNTYDLVYTSNGVHVWIDNLNGMYRNIHRIMKPGGVYILYEIHPFLRPFDDNLKVQKPYDSTGPFESDIEITYHWRIMDILNAILGSGLTVKHMEEMFDEKDYDNPFWVPCEELVKGETAAAEEVDRMYDWQVSPIAALPNWMCIAAQKTEDRNEHH
jgi:SAM-dependent methyltransferase